MAIIVIFVRFLECESMYANGCSESDNCYPSSRNIQTPGLVGCLVIKASHVVSVCWTIINMLLIYQAGEFWYV
jgi:hypothetical protein